MRDTGRIETVVAVIALMLIVLILRGGAESDGNDPSRSPQAAALADGKSVRDFGAVGDGRHDDTAAIQRAVDAGVGDIVFPRGTWRITRPVGIDLAKVGPISLTGRGAARVVMAGSGPAFRIRGTHGGTAAPHTVKPAVWERERTPLIDGLEIVGGHPEADGIDVSGTMQAIFSRVTVRQARHGIRLYERNRNVIITACHLYDNSGAGIFLDRLNLHQINIGESHISYNDGGGIVVRGSEIRNLQITGCDIEGNMGAESPPTANILIDTTEGSVREGAIIGCTIQHTHLAPDSANIRMIGRSTQERHKVGHFAISDNAMSDVAVNIDLLRTRGVTIQGNTLWKGFKANLRAVESSNIVLGPNLFDRNPDYRPADSANSLLFVDCRDCTLQGIHLNNAKSAEAGLILRRCSWFNVTGCTILDCDRCGLLIDECDTVRVSDCLIRAASEGEQPEVAVQVVGGKDVVFRDNAWQGTVERDNGASDIPGNHRLPESGAADR